MKANRNRAIGQIDASSTADIAFLLLVFFLVTATMASDIGITRKLPPPNADGTAEVPERNVQELLVNGQNQLLVDASSTELPELKSLVVEHLLNPDAREDMPVQLQVSEAICRAKLQQLNAAGSTNPAVTRWEKRLETSKVLGNYEESQAVISLQAHRATSYATYVAVQDALSGAYAAARDQAARRYLGKPFEVLSPTQQQAVQRAVPQRISEAEPSNAQ